MDLRLYRRWKFFLPLLCFCDVVGQVLEQACAYIHAGRNKRLDITFSHPTDGLSRKNDGIRVSTYVFSSLDKDGTQLESEANYIEHVPVMLQESVDMLVTNADGRYMDVTLGYGGHAEEILKRLSTKGQLFGADRDPEAVHYTGKRLQEYVDSGKLVPLIGTFSNLPLMLKSKEMPSEGYSGIIADLGISTHQLECARRGFAYHSDGPLDMRMSNPLHDPFSVSNSIDPLRSLETSNTAYKIINKGREYDIAKIIREYGEENRAALIAKRIVEKRQHSGQISTTQQLREIILGCVHGNHKTGMKVLSRVFQAFRIYVNDEMTELEKLLEWAPQMLHRKHGRLIIISYHSLEDRLVKHRFIDLHSRPKSPLETSIYRLVTKKCLMAKDAENRINQKARSAKLRCIERCKYVPPGSTSTSH